MKNYVREGQKLPLFGVGPYIVYGMAAVIIFGIILCAYILKIGNLDGPWILTFRIIGGILIVLGLVIWYIGALRSGMDEHIAENRLKTDGIYAWVRNPMYSGWWMILSGIGLMWHNAALLMTIPKLQRSFKPQLGDHDRHTDKHGGEVAAQSVRTGVPGLLQTGQPLPANDTKKEGGATMKKYEPKALVAVSRYQNYFPSLPTELRRDIYARMDELLIEEKAYCDKGNYAHMAQIITSIALYEVLQKHGKSEQEAYRIVSEEMWKFLDPAPMQKLARKRFFLPLMKKLVPFGFRKGSGHGWRYTWHKDDPKDEFRFECNECIYQKILGKRGLMKLGTMCCHADIINYGNLPYTDFIRTQTLCQGGDLCDFRFVRHSTDAGDGWERSKSI